MVFPLRYGYLSKTFHYFPANDCYVGFNFLKQSEAKMFFNIVNKVNKKEAKMYKTAKESRANTYTDIDGSTRVFYFVY